MKIAIIGAGNMGGSIARGLAKGSLIDDSDIIVSNPSAGKLEKLKKEFPGISTTNNNLEAATGADIVILRRVRFCLGQRAAAQQRERGGKKRKKQYLTHN